MKMTSFRGIIKGINTLRPCMVAIQKGGEEKRALFHCWNQWATVVAPSILKGGHTGGQFSETYGIVEFEDGTVQNTYPQLIRFLDSSFDEYCWEEGKTDE